MSPIVYYLCDLHSSQPAKGQLRYDRLARTYQVTFCSYTVFPQRREYLSSFSIRHDVDYELLHDAVQAVIIELSKLDDVVKKPPETMTDLEKFSVFFEYAANPVYRDTVNKIIESEEVLTVASNVLMSIGQDERERAIIPMANAINLYLRQIVLRRGIPFLLPIHASIQVFQSA